MKQTQRFRVRIIGSGLRLDWNSADSRFSQKTLDPGYLVFSKHCFWWKTGFSCNDHGFCKIQMSKPWKTCTFSYSLQHPNRLGFRFCIRGLGPKTSLTPPVASLLNQPTNSPNPASTVNQRIQQNKSIMESMNPY